MECTLEAETSVSNFTQYKLFIGDDKKNTFFGMTFSFKKGGGGVIRHQIHTIFRT